MRPRVWLAVTLAACTPRSETPTPAATNAPATATATATADVPPDAGATFAGPILAPKWRAKAKVADLWSLARVGGRTTVVALEPDGKAMWMRDATTGAETWRTSGFQEGPWSRIAIGRTAIVAMGTDDKKGWAHLLGIADGKRSWTHVAIPPPKEWTFGDDGVHVVVREECAIRLVDVATGESGAVAFSGALMHMRPMQRDESGTYTDHGFTRCAHEPRVVGGAPSRPVLELVSDKDRKTTFVAVDPKARTAPSGGVTFESPFVFTAAKDTSDEKSAVVWTRERELVVAKLDFVPPRIVWKRSFPVDESCATPRREVRFVGDALVVQACNRVMRLDPQKGTTAWTHDVGDALAAIEGEASPLEADSFVEVAHEPAVVQWLDGATGAAKARVTVAKGAHDLYLSTAGVIAHRRVDGVTGVLELVGNDGAVKWHRGPSLYGASRVGRYVATGWTKSASEHAYVLLDAPTGAVAGVLPGANRLLGVVADATIIALGNDEVLAFDVPK